ncbi:flagellar motor protein MotB [Clostridium sp. ZS2-4]|uniref:flagellar motor protein MotB n=1 Tax=Clostridium sp. ZS2-4 TaxID=2987703 RepID=UPI00227A99E5|nr:flagellar motor protein MotB [Clostridium sp. ZS2-4]MCY6354011.1 OmpA family protein [Clostridium sp. ZS2-4]
MSRRKKPQSDGGANEEWLATYADTITLILTFFVLLYSFSSIDAVKFQRISSSLQSVLSGKSDDSILEFNMSGEVPIVGAPIDMGPKQTGTTESEQMYKKIKGFIDSNNLKDTIQIKTDSRGVIMELKDNVLFDIGKAEIKNSSKAILDKINSLISTFPNEVIVEGHTDNVPINTAKYPSNWELSTQRAVNVLKYFVQVKRQNPQRFQAAGYGEYRPIAPNSNDTNRAKNRRVNILITSGERKKK